MSNSSLICYTKLSPNCNKPRNHVIDTISIHCTAGNKDNTAKQIVSLTRFTTYDPEDGASCNYAVGGDGSIALGVDEANRSWCTSSGVNDHRAVTIEVASNIPGTEVNAAAYAALLDLVTDICKRNGIKRLIWSTNKADRVGHLNGCNMTVHRDYAAKSCPGEWLYSRHGAIATEVNKRLGAATVTPDAGGTLYRVQCGAFSVKANADALAAKLKAAGYQTYTVKADGLYKVQTGAFAVKSNATKLESELKKKGFSTYITTKAGTPA